MSTIPPIRSRCWLGSVARVTSVPDSPQDVLTDPAEKLASLGRDTNSFGTKCSGLGRPRRAVSGTAPGG